MGTSETWRNAILRRADWRFLLPSPRPDVAAVYVDGTLAEAVRTVSARVLDGRDTTPNASCDLAVAVDPDCATLRSAWAALRAGGSCYTEWTAKWGGAPAAARRRLASAGFTKVALYTPRPAPEHGTTQAWVPLGVARAARWYLARNDTRRGLRPALARTARRAGWQVAGWLPVVSPVCAVARKPGSDAERGRPASSLNDFQAELEGAVDMRRAGDLLPGRGRLPWVVQTHGVHSVNKVVLLRLRPDGAAEIVVKVPRTPQGARGLEAEAAVLGRLGDAFPNVPGIPRLLFSGVYAGVRAVGQTAVHGVPLSRLSKSTDYRELAMKAANWQARLVDPAGPQPRASWWDRLVDPVLTYADECFGGVNPGLVRDTRRALARLQSLPLACEQRDFSPWNVLSMPSGDLGVLDWESAEPAGLPALDLIYFLTYLAAYRERASTAARMRDVHRATLDPATDLGRATRDCLHWYAARAGIDAAALGPLRVLCWLVHSWSECRRLTDDGDSVPDLSALRRSIFVALWQQELERAWRAAA